MRKVLYITNIEVPYRVKFFNSLSERTDLTVLYERNNSANRNSEWAKSVNASYKKHFLEGLKISNENSFSFKIFKYLNGNYDDIIISCFNSPVQMMAILYLRLRGKKYILSFDGEQFIGESGLKNHLKKFFIKGADKYLVAGEKSAENIKKLVGDKEVFPYYFSSYTEEELTKNQVDCQPREKYVLVVGQYFDYKGLDIALKVARLDRTIRYKFVGMGKRTKLFVKEQLFEEDTNIEVVPFLQKKDLITEYKKAGVLLLPSRKECWGLVINEAASFGTPIISTVGSGAAMEFLRGEYEKYLFSIDDTIGIQGAIHKLLTQEDGDYSRYLIETGAHYSVEKMVEAHENALNV
ncbi:glycosyltransferase family 4 protein [Pseudobutyrivibrio xylanivorans]|uniref:Glycosyl transferase family 4 n=1 Tax=Pseudobutyrivibrio xylanivorans TaxID=185007 RepID=A0A5P6VVB5_PSEXY|nr:glycosyltransferase family 4 protein [Pseudobutyrivibrio xylanivorans]QFJ56298.1 glycosyl transferase family 4 [Pseudobutyrivibrio xylanivorans]